MSGIARVVKHRTSKTNKVEVRPLTGQALLDDMAAYRQKVTASPEAARKFLINLGVLTPTGKMKRLIRD